MNPSEKEMERYERRRENVTGIKEYEMGKYLKIFKLIIQLYRRVCYDCGAYSDRMYLYEKSYHERHESLKESDESSNESSLNKSVDMSDTKDSNKSRKSMSSHKADKPKRIRKDGYKSNRAYAVMQEGYRATNRILEEIQSILIKSGIPKNDLERIERYEKHLYIEDRKKGEYCTIFPDTLDVPKSFP